MPARLRDVLGRTIVVTRGLDQSLFVYPIAAWQEFAGKLEKLPMSESRARTFARLMLSGAVEVELDALGRVLIPEYLAAHADLKKEVVVLGVGSRLEVWNKEHWEKYQMKESEDLGETVEGLKEFGI